MAGLNYRAIAHTDWLRSMAYPEILTLWERLTQAHAQLNCMDATEGDWACYDQALADYLTAVEAVADQEVRPRVPRCSTIRCGPIPRR